MKNLTAKEVAEALGVTKRTANVYCQKRLLVGAFRVNTPVGTFWQIPPEALEGFTKPSMGRPKKKQSRRIDIPA